MGFTIKPLQATRSIAFVGKVMIALPRPVNTALWKQLQAPEGWKKHRSILKKDSVVYTCLDMSKQMTLEQWEAVEAHVLLILEQQ